jgi:hypothetical protein
MTDFSNYAENGLLDHILNVSALTQPTSLQLSLHTADPGEDGTSNEVVGGSYAKQAITFGAASAGVSSMSNSPSFTNMPAVTVSHIAIWDQGSNCLFKGALSASKTVNSGDTYNQSTLTITLD